MKLSDALSVLSHASSDPNSFTNCIELAKAQEEQIHILKVKSAALEKQAIQLQALANPFPSVLDLYGASKPKLFSTDPTLLVPARTHLIIPNIANSILTLEILFLFYKGSTAYGVVLNSNTTTSLNGSMLSFPISFSYIKKSLLSRLFTKVHL